MSGFSQDNDGEINTLFSKVERVSGFTGPFMSFSNLGGEFTHVMGGGAGIIINNQFLFGGYGMGSTTAIKQNSTTYGDHEITMAHGGFFFAYVIKPKMLIHPVIGLHTGWGDVLLDSETYQVEQNDYVFILLPVAELEINMAQFFKIGVGVSYRTVFGIKNLEGYTNDNFSGMAAFISFKLGWFSAS